MGCNLINRVKRLESQSPKPIAPLIISLWDEKCDKGGFEGYEALIDGVAYKFYGNERDDVIENARLGLPTFYEPRFVELNPI